MPPQVVPILLVAVAAVLGAVGQFVFKSAAGRITGIVSFLMSPRVLLGMMCYVAVMALTTVAFRRGGAVNVLYPVYASTFIWAAVIAAVFFHRPIRPVHVGGMVLLLAGIACMSRGHGAD